MNNYKYSQLSEAGPDDMEIYEDDYSQNQFVTPKSLYKDIPRKILEDFPERGNYKPQIIIYTPDEESKSRAKVAIRNNSIPRKAVVYGDRFVKVLEDNLPRNYDTSIFTVELDIMGLQWRDVK